MPTQAASPSPLDVKAEGIALLAMGYSTREVERRLKAKFPAGSVPRYNTIARWMRSAHQAQRGKTGGRPAMIDDIQSRQPPPH